MNEQEYTDEEILNMEVLNKQEARAYVEKKTKMGRGLWEEEIRDRLNFRPMIKNFKRQRYSHEVVPKMEVDKLIIKLKKGLLDSPS